MRPSERLAGFLAECRVNVRGDLRDDLLTRVLYSTDASLYQIMPHAVLVPRTTEDVLAAMSSAAAYGVPVLPRGAGTSLAGQAVNEALVIDFSRHLDQILEIDVEGRLARVQPGVVLDDLNDRLRSHGLKFGPDPASSNRSTIGGAVANNATGSHSLLYGMTVDHVRGMKVVLSDGSEATLGGQNDANAGYDDRKIRIAREIDRLARQPDHQRIIREGTPPYWRRCGGYNLDRFMPGGTGNLAQLICGSEGTLAIMTEITVGLVPVPASTGLALLQFDEVHLALSAVEAILETGATAVELLDPLGLRLCRDVPEYARLLASVVEGSPHCLLVVEYSGESEAAVTSAIERLRKRVAAEKPGVTALLPATSDEAQAAVWQVRKAGLGLLMSMKGDMKPVPFIEDAAVPVEHLATYVAQVEDYCAQLDVPVSYYAHAGAGCLHIRPLINRRKAGQLARMPDIALFSAGLVRAYGGALSSEHGDGRSRSWLNESFYGPELYGLYKEVKRVFDPNNLLNPGIIVDSAAILQDMRPLAESAGPARLDFSDYEVNPAADLRIAIPHVHRAEPHPDGFAASVEMCNGAGVCRKRGSGTMCPSFMVTRDEEHSTRGRANALRAAMSGVLPAGELTSRRMYGVMDLCISCKACHSECPSAVDMARIKAEFLARYYEVHGTPARARFFGHSASLSRLGSGIAAPLSNAVLGSRAGRKLTGRLFGLSPRRTLPALANVPFETWWRRRPAAGAGIHGEVVLLIDPFTNYNYPAVGQAAVGFLEAVGVRVADAIAIDDGRAAFSKGLIGRARQLARS
ncbi:MAG TPA: FAD-linked oxidase C-terminal domain-containing protein, partial [Promineifilum sp.]